MPTDTATFIDTIINNALVTANSNTVASTEAANQLIAENVGFFLEPPTNLTGFEVTAVEPTIPTVDDTIITYESQIAKLVDLFSNQLAGFFAIYYPLQSDAFDEATAWLVNSITNGGTGINVNIETQTWQRARENIITDGLRVENQIITGYAAKGYSIPPGSMLKKIEEARYDQAGKIGIAATTIAAKQLEIEIETIKFAVGKAIESRTMAMNAAADYIRAIASAPDSASRVANLNGDAQAKMMSAVSDLYRAKLGRDELVLNSKLAELDKSVDIYKHRRDNATENDRVKIQALAAACEVFARTAAAALSSLNSVVSESVNAIG